MKSIFSNYKTSIIGFISLSLGFYIGFVANDWLIASPFITSGFGFFLTADGNSANYKLKAK